MDIITRIMAANTNEVKIGIKTGTSNLNTILGTLIDWVAIIAGIVAFFYLVYSGFLYITAAGNPDQAKKGGQGIINAIIGIIVISLAWMLTSALRNGIS